MQTAAAMKAAASANAPFTDAELDAAVLSLKCLIPDEQESVDWEALKSLYASCAHLSHKDWAQTQKSAAALEKIIGTPDSPIFRKMFSRVLQDGQWDAAEKAAASRAAETQPWVVLVTGLNGIRKTTSVHQPWFKELLRQSLGSQFDSGSSDELPAGTDSFFRQLDYMIATVALEQFKALYALGRDLDDEGCELNDSEAAQCIQDYATFKEAIFARYRTMAEVLGVLLVRACAAKRMNVMVETSGRDVGMYAYVDTLFPGEASGYRKLVINFSINEIGFAERSVDTRMRMEMKVGKAALSSAAAAGESSGGAGAKIIRANAGGPYGSSVLAGVQADSKSVWQTILQAGEGDVGYTWSKASVAIEASERPPWRARAVPSGDAGEQAGAAATWEFGPKPA